MNLSTRDDILNRLARIGKAGPLPKNLDIHTAGLIDQMQRQIGELKAACQQLMGSAFDGPQHGADAFVFTIDARADSEGHNILTSAEAAAEGLPEIDGFVIYRHSSGLLLNRYSISSWALATPDDPLVNAGGIRIHAFDNQRTILHLDASAFTQEVVATMSFFPGKPVPVKFAERPPNSVQASGQKGQVYQSGAVSPLELP